MTPRRRGALPTSSAGPLESRSSNDRTIRTRRIPSRTSQRLASCKRPAVFLLPVEWILVNTKVHRPGVSYLVLRRTRYLGWTFQCSFNEGGQFFNFHINFRMG